MKTFLLVIMFFTMLFGGYLVYDWISVSNKRANAPVVSIYSWKDAQGTVHFSDKNPPAGTASVHQTKGKAYVAPPMAIRMKEKAFEWVGKAKGLIPERGGKKSRK